MLTTCKPNFLIQENHTKKDMQDLPTWSSFRKSLTTANFNTLSRIEEIVFAHGIFGVKPSLC